MRRSEQYLQCKLNWVPDRLSFLAAGALAQGKAGARFDCINASRALHVKPYMVYPNILNRKILDYHTLVIICVHWPSPLCMHVYYSPSLLFTGTHSPSHAFTYLHHALTFSILSPPLVCTLLHLYALAFTCMHFPRGEGLAYERSGDARRKFWIKPQRGLIWAWPIASFFWPLKRPDKWKMQWLFDDGKYIII